jgi:hypothetical protein
MKLTLLQRIQLAPFIPTKGSYTDLVIAEDLRKKINLTQDEISTNKIEVMPGDNGKSQVQIATNIETEIEFTELEFNLVKGELEKLEKTKTLEAYLLPLYRLFVLSSKPLPSES